MREVVHAVLELSGPPMKPCLSDEQDFAIDLQHVFHVLPPRAHASDL